MPVITVSKLNNYMKRYIEQNIHLSDLWVKGEVSNYKKHYSGHIYLTLKDGESCLKVVMFKAFAAKLSFEIKDGSKVIIFGRISVFEQSGTYQLYAQRAIPDGVGELYEAYTQLKDKLEKKGMFSSEHKKKPPVFPRRVGIVSSAGGAALHDILNVIKRRYPVCNLVIYPAKVQGIGSSDTICDGINCLENEKNCDVIIIARGGGSIEDLWAFNEEKTAYAIYNCNVPIISGVGHETDYTIADFVSDLRAPTPSAAAEIAVPDLYSVYKNLTDVQKILNNLIFSKIDAYYSIIEKYSSDKIYLYFSSFLQINLSKLEKSIKSLEDLFNMQHFKTENHLSLLLSSLEALNPLCVLKRGYSFITDENGFGIDCMKLKCGDNINVRFNGGMAECNVRRIDYEKR